MTDNLPIPSPPPDLVERLRAEAPHGIRDAGVTRELHLINAAYAAGADHELEACCEWLEKEGPSGIQLWGDDLRIARRPKPRSQAEEALIALEQTMILLMPVTGGEKVERLNTIRVALERLHEFERTAAN